MILTRLGFVLINLNWFINGKMLDGVVEFWGSTFSVSNVGPSRTLTIISLVFNVSYFFNEVLKKVKSTELIGYLPWNCGTKV